MKTETNKHHSTIGTIVVRFFAWVVLILGACVGIAIILGSLSAVVTTFVKEWPISGFVIVAVVTFCLVMIPLYLLFEWALMAVSKK